MRPFSIYIHIPYCHQKCPYCDFNTYAVSSAPETDYTSALLAELDWKAAQEDWAGRPVQTIYFGGGTPSIFSTKSIKRILSVISQLFPTLDDIEISLEANPGTVSTDNLSGYRDAGVNRISFGGQSFNNDILKTLGRLHTPDQVEAAVESARVAGYRNMSMDLIYGVPNQTVSDLRTDALKCIELELPHVSGYSLTIEKGTPFYQSYKRGILKPAKDEIVLEMMHELTDVLSGGGLERYEISNFAMPLKEARHNLAYWNGDDYLGLGAGAHSFISYADKKDPAAFGKRWSNYALPQRYMESATTIGSAESWSETVDRSGSMFEFFFLGLRKTAGVSLDRFQDLFGESAETLYGELFEILLHEKLLEREGQFIRLSRRGTELADSVIENFARTR